jgi:hypothetical protein
VRAAACLLLVAALASARNSSASSSGSVSPTQRRRPPRGLRLCLAPLAKALGAWAMCPARCSCGTVLLQCTAYRYIPKRSALDAAAAAVAAAPQAPPLLPRRRCCHCARVPLCSRLATPPLLCTSADHIRVRVVLSISRPYSAHIRTHLHPHTACPRTASGRVSRLRRKSRR